MRVEVLVIGSGVAGAYTAMRLAREGVRVALIDKAHLPRHKVCGCCLNAEAVGLLDDAGLWPKLASRGARPIEHVTVYSGGYSLPLASHGGVAVSRYALDEILAREAASAGCAIYHGTTGRVVALPDAPGKPVVVACVGKALGGEQCIEADIVIAADGLAGACLTAVDPRARKIWSYSLRGYGSQLRSGTQLLNPGEVIMRCGAGGYVGTVVLEDGTLDVAAAMCPRWVKASGGPGPAATLIAEVSGDPLQGLKDASWRATALLTGRRRRVALPGVFVVGDAAGYVEPFTGEGMAWAMRSAERVVPLVLQARAGWSPTLGTRWQQAYCTSVRRRQWRCRILAALLRRPRLVSGLVAAGSALPSVGRAFALRIFMPSLHSGGGLRSAALPEGGAS